MTGVISGIPVVVVVVSVVGISVAEADSVVEVDTSFVVSVSFVDDERVCEGCVWLLLLEVLVSSSSVLSLANLEICLCSNRLY